MVRPIWKGHISFGLVNIPVTLFGAESRFDLHFQMLDSRNHGRIRYERVNEQTGEEVPWNEIVKAFEYDDNNYVLLKDEDLQRLKAEANQTIEISDFVKANDIDAIYFEKPYYLVPGKKGEKGYVLLRETLRRSGKIGIARVVIRSRQYLAALMPLQDALIINLMRWPQELRSIKEFDVPHGSISDFKISSAEIKMGLQLIEAMTRKWNPDNYHDETREKMLHWIEEQVGKGRIAIVKQKQKEAEEPEGKEERAPNIVDMMDLLKKSVAERGRPSRSGRRRAGSDEEEHAATGTEGRHAQAGRSESGGHLHVRKPAPARKTARRKK